MKEKKISLDNLKPKIIIFPFNLIKPQKYQELAVDLQILYCQQISNLRSNYQQLLGSRLISLQI